MKLPASVESCMTRYPTVISGKTRVSEALELMERFQIRHLPVVDKERVIGITSDRDLKKAALLGCAATLVAPEFMTPEPYCVPEGTELSRVARTMASRKFGSAVVTSRSGEVIGIFTTVDALEALARVLEEARQAPGRAPWKIEDILGTNYRLEM